MDVQTVKNLSTEVHNPRRRLIDSCRPQFQQRAQYVKADGLTVHNFLAMNCLLTQIGRGLSDISVLQRRHA
jgi:hypothetical protein